jgi:nitrate/nitrite transporter NarK
MLVLGSLFVGDAKVAVLLMSLGAFLAAMAGPCAFTTTIDVGGPYVPQVVAVMNSAGNVAAMVCPILVGMFFASVEDWNKVLWGFAAIYLIAGICWLLVDAERPIVAPDDARINDQ